MSAHTVLAYGNDLEQFHAFLSQYGYPEPGSWKATHIRAWMNSLITDGISPRSVHRKVSALRALLKHLRLQHGLKTDPMAKVVLPKIPARVVQDIPAADLLSMFRNFPWEEHETGMRDKTLLLAFYTSGMRLSELIGLRCRDLDLKRNTLNVLGKRNKQRLIPIHPELAELLAAMVVGKRPIDPVFALENGKPMYPVFVYRIVTSYLRLFSSAMKTSPHVLRHSFATHMLNNGADLLAIKDLLGHASLSATQVYTKNSFERLKAIHRLHPRG